MRKGKCHQPVKAVEDFYGHRPSDRCNDRCAVCDSEASLRCLRCRTRYCGSHCRQIHADAGHTATCPGRLERWKDPVQLSRIISNALDNAEASSCSFVLPPCRDDAYAGCLHVVICAFTLLDDASGYVCAGCRRPRDASCLPTFVFVNRIGFAACDGDLDHGPGEGCEVGMAEPGRTGERCVEAVLRLRASDDVDFRTARPDLCPPACVLKRPPTSSNHLADIMIPTSDGVWAVALPSPRLPEDQVPEHQRDHQHPGDARVVRRLLPLRELSSRRPVPSRTGNCGHMDRGFGQVPRAFVPPIGRQTGQALRQKRGHSGGGPWGQHPGVKDVVRLAGALSTASARRVNISPLDLFA